MSERNVSVLLDKEIPISHFHEHSIVKSALTSCRPFLASEGPAFLALLSSNAANCLATSDTAFLDCAFAWHQSMIIYKLLC